MKLLKSFLANFNVIKNISPAQTQQAAAEYYKTIWHSQKGLYSQYRTKNIDGQVVLISGAGGGIGQAIACRFAEEGCKLVLLDRNMEIDPRTNYGLLATKQKILEQSQVLKQYDIEQRLCLVQMDLLNQSNIRNILSHPEIKAFNINYIDILINNVGGNSGTGYLGENNLDDALRDIDITLKPAYTLIHGLIPSMRERDMGHIVNICSICGIKTGLNMSAYYAAKHAIRALSNCARDELGETMVRVTAIHPGTVKTQLVKDSTGGDEKKFQEYFPENRFMEPEDVAESILFAVTRPQHMQVTDIVIKATKNDKYEKECYR